MLEHCSIALGGDIISVYLDMFLDTPGFFKFSVMGVFPFYTSERGKSNHAKFLFAPFMSNNRIKFNIKLLRCQN